MNTTPILPTEIEHGRKATRLALQVVGVCLQVVFGAGFVFMLTRFAPQYRWGVIPWIMLVLSAIALYTHKRSKELEGRDRLVFRFSEIVTLLVLLLFFMLVRDGLANITLSAEFWKNFFDFQVLFVLITASAAWLVTTYLSSLYDQIEDRELDADWEDIGRVHNSLKSLRIHIIGVSAGMLVLLVILTTFSSIPIEIQNLVSIRAGPPAPVWLLIFFVILMLVQLNLTQLTLLRARWRLDRAVVERAVTRQWIVSGLVMLVLIGIFAAVMPTEYSIGFFDMVAWLVNALFSIGTFILLVITYPIVLLLRLLAPKENEALEPLSLPTIQTPPSATDPAAPLPIWELIKAILLWGTLGLIVVFALYQFISANRSEIKRLSGLPFYRWVSGLLQWILNLFRGAGQLIREQMERIQLNRLVQMGKVGSARSPSRHAQNAREMIWALYQELVIYAGERGFRRHTSQTPYQYHDVIASELPVVDKEITDITDSFVEARYSLHPVDESTVNRVNQESNTVKQAIDKKKDETAADSSESAA